MGGGVWLGGGGGVTDWVDCACGRKVSTQRKYACVFAGSDVRGSAKELHLHASFFTMRTHFNAWAPRYWIKVG